MPKKRLPPEGWAAFREHMLDLLPDYDVRAAAPGELVPPSDLREQLRRIEHALERALLVLQGLEYREGQDPVVDDYRKRVAELLKVGHVYVRSDAGSPTAEPLENYPTATVASMRALAQAARYAHDKVIPPQEGCSEHRSEVDGRRARLAKDFCMEHVAAFDVMPSYSDGSFELALLEELFDRAGLDERVPGKAIDVRSVLRTAIKKVRGEPGGLGLLTAAGLTEARRRTVVSQE